MNIRGTLKADGLYGTYRNDVIRGLDGNDFLFDYLGGNDLLYGNKGDDHIVTRYGYDKAYGGNGDDVLEVHGEGYGGAGVDQIMATR